MKVMKPQPLTVDYINSHAGEIIEWYCSGYQHNHPYKGRCKLTGQWEPDKHRPMVIRPIVEHIEGNDLNLAWDQYGTLTYSDDDRPVSFIKIEGAD